MKLFLSYAHKDYLEAKKLYDKLILLPEVEVWFDKESLLPGQKWEHEIRKAIPSSQFFLLLLSEHSTQKKGFYQREIRLALTVLEEYPDGDIYLIPIRLDSCEPHFEQLKALHYVDLFPNWENGFQKIVKTIGGGHSRWKLEYVFGNSFQLHDGIAGTKTNNKGHESALFPLETTIIMGDSNKKPPFNKSKHTIATWSISLESYDVSKIKRCYLIIGCLRRHGGLHSPVSDDFVVLSINEANIDAFEIKIIPDGQTDYFYQRPFPDIPIVSPFDICETLYAWPIPTTHLFIDQNVQVKVSIATRTKWDIDYVGLMSELT